MSEFKFTFRGKRYRVKKKAVAAVGIALLLLVLVIILIIMQLRSGTPEEPEEVPEETAETEVYDASAGVVDKKKYSGTMLEESEDAGEEYIESTLFLGDSNTARFLAVVNTETKKTFTSKENTIGVVGMGIDAISSLACMDFSTGRFTMPKSVAILQPERVIITMGTNNLYGSSTDSTSFIERYVKGIRAIKEAYPSVDIIVNAIPPVSKNTTYTNVKMVQIDAYNQAIAKMCQDNKWKFLDSSEALKDEKSGYAKDGYMVSDGLHLSEKGLAALFDYIRTHSYITEDDRPKPLAAIPTIIGVPAGLIRTDPLTNEDFTEDPTTTETEAVPETTASTEPTETPEETEEATAAPTATPTPTSTPTPVVTEDPAITAARTACQQSGGTWTESGCACQTGYQLGADGICYQTQTETAVPETPAETPAENTPTPSANPTGEESGNSDNPSEESNSETIPGAGTDNTVQ